MKRGQPLKRCVALGRSKNPPGPPWTTVRGLSPSKPSKPRRPLKAKGARAKRVAEEMREFREAVLERAGWRCERCQVFERDAPYGLDAHHRRARSQGGSNHWRNGAALCGGADGCHAQVTDHRAKDWRDWITQTKPKRGSK